MFKENTHERKNVYCGVGYFGNDFVNCCKAYSCFHDKSTSICIDDIPYDAQAFIVWPQTRVKAIKVNRVYVFSFTILLACHIYRCVRQILTPGSFPSLVPITQFQTKTEPAYVQSKM